MASICVVWQHHLVPHAGVGREIEALAYRRPHQRERYLKVVERQIERARPRRTRAR
jgi:hypothetical protein